MPSIGDEYHSLQHLEVAIAGVFSSAKPVEAMGRSPGLNCLQQICGSYLHRASCSFKQMNGGWSEAYLMVSAYRKSVSLSSPSASRGVVSKSFPVVEITGRGHYAEQSLLHGLQTSATTASNRPSHSSLNSRHSASVFAYTPGRVAFYCEPRCGMSSGAKHHGDKETISVTFVNKDGEETEIRVPTDMSMLEAAHENDIELEGACEGSLACSTCHVIVMDEKMYSKLPEPTDEENDMLDLAFGLTETSRLGCQVIAGKEVDGLRLALPAATRNFAVDGHVPKPH